MIAKVFPKGSGGIEYVLSKDYANVISGDPQITQSLIENYSEKSQNPSTSGVLSFHEDLSGQNDLLESLCQRYQEEVLFCGIDPSEYSITWVEHREPSDANPSGWRTGLHYVANNEHLPTGKRIQPYWDNHDRNHKDSWQQLVNAEHEFSSPNDPDRQRTMSVGMNIPTDVKELRIAIDNHLTQSMEEGRVQNYDDVKHVLTDELGFEIKREGMRKGVHRISIKTEEHDKNINLVGAYYEPEFNITDQQDPGRDRQIQESIRTSDTRIRELRERVQTGIEKRSRRNSELYEWTPPTDSEIGIKSSPVDDLKLSFVKQSIDDRGFDVPLELDEISDPNRGTADPSRGAEIYPIIERNDHPEPSPEDSELGTGLNDNGGIEFCYQQQSEEQDMGQSQGSELLYEISSSDNISELRGVLRGTTEGTGLDDGERTRKGFVGRIRDFYARARQQASRAREQTQRIGDYCSRVASIGIEEPRGEREIEQFHGGLTAIGETIRGSCEQLLDRVGAFGEKVRQRFEGLGERSEAFPRVEGSIPGIGSETVSISRLTDHIEGIKELGGIKDSVRGEEPEPDINEDHGISW